MQVERRLIESGLRTKGFVEESNHHRYFYHEYKGKRTGVYTYTSHGSNYKTYGMPLLKLIKKQLKLDNIRDTVDLFKCPISEDDYNDILKKKGLIT